MLSLNHTSLPLIKPKLQELIGVASVCSHYADNPLQLFNPRSLELEITIHTLDWLYQ